MNKPITNSEFKENPSFLYSKGQEVLSGIFQGVIKGGISYCVIYLSTRTDKALNAIVTPLPYILKGTIDATVVQLAQLTYAAAINLLGDRNSRDQTESSSLRTIRERSWKLLTKIEDVNTEIDRLFSRAFNIRTEKEVRKLFPDNDALASSDIKLMEIVRQSLCEVVSQALTISLPSEIGFYAVSAMGFNILRLTSFHHLFLIQLTLNIFIKLSIKEGLISAVPAVNNPNPLESNHEDKISLRNLFSESSELEIQL